MIELDEQLKKSLTYYYYFLAVPVLIGLNSKQREREREGDQAKIIIYSMASNKG